LFPAASPPPSGTKTGFFSGFAGGVTGAVLGGMLFHILGITVPGWGAEFGMVDIFLILFILGIIFYEMKRLRNWRATKAAATRAGRSPYSSTYPGRTTGGSRRDSYMDQRRPARPPGIR
jgi:predicted lipid-binding transport protein (Tim44 family)